MQDRWYKLPPLRTPRSGAAIEAVNGFVYVIGGRSGGSFTSPYTLDTVECYDPQAGAWLDVGNMPTGRCDGAVVVL